MSEQIFAPGDRIEWWDNGHGARRESSDEDAVRHEGVVSGASTPPGWDHPTAYFVERRNGLGERWTSWVRVGWARLVERAEADPQGPASSAARPVKATPTEPG